MPATAISLEATQGEALTVISEAFMQSDLHSLHRFCRDLPLRSLQASMPVHAKHRLT